MTLLIALALGTTIAVPQRANADVSIAADGPVVAIVWSAAGSSGSTDIFSAVSADSGRTFSAPIRVNDVAGDAKVNGEQPPRVALTHHDGRQPTITVVWPSKGASGTRLLHATSEDGGKTFGKAASVPGSDAAGNRGWQSATADARGRVGVIWLDHRELAVSDAQMSTMHHEMASADKPDGVAMAQKSKLYFATLDGAVPPQALTGGVCYCCKTAVVSGSDGAIYTAWRQVYPGNIRDIAFTSSRDGGKTFAPPSRVSEDKWVLEGCPEDGPSLAVDDRNRVHIVWPTLVQGGKDGEANLALFYAVSNDGRTFTSRERIPTQGTPHHPQLTLDRSGHPVVTWDEAESGTRRVAVARAQSAGSGAPTFVRQILSESERAIYPVAVTAGSNDVIVAWTSGEAAESTIRIVKVP